MVGGPGVSRSGGLEAPARVVGWWLAYLDIYLGGRRSWAGTGGGFRQP